MRGTEDNGDSQRGMLYLIAGAGYGTLVVYLILVIQQGMNIPILSSGEVSNVSGALSTAVLISAMVYVTIWFFMSGKNHSFFTEDPDKAKFYAGIIGLAALVIIAISWEDYQREMIISAILTAISSWSYISDKGMFDRVYSWSLDEGNIKILLPQPLKNNILMVKYTPNGMECLYHLIMVS